MAQSSDENSDSDREAPDEQEPTGLAVKRPRLADNEQQVLPWAKPSVGTWMLSRPRTRQDAASGSTEGAPETPQEEENAHWSVIVEIDQCLPFDLVWPAFEEGVISSLKSVCPMFSAMGWESRAQLVDSLRVAVEAGGCGAIARGLRQDQAERIVSLLTGNISCYTLLDPEGAKLAKTATVTEEADPSNIADTASLGQEKVWTAMIEMDPGFPFRDAWDQIERDVHAALRTVNTTWLQMGWTGQQEMHRKLQEGVEANGAGPIARGLEREQAERVVEHLKGKMPSFVKVDRAGAAAAERIRADGSTRPAPSTPDDRSAKVIVSVDRKRLLPSAIGPVLAPNAKKLRPGTVHVKYEGEDGQDGGGVTRSFLAQVGGLLADPRFGLLLPAPDAQLQLHPMPGFLTTADGGEEGVRDHTERWSRFFGRVLGMSVVHECPLGLCLVAPLCKQLLAQDPSFDDLRFVPGLSEGGSGWYQSLRSLVVQEDSMHSSNEFAMDVDDVNSALYGLEASMPSKAQQVFESLTHFICSVGHSCEQWTMAVEIATRLLRESPTDSHRNIVLRSAKELFQGIAQAHDLTIAQGDASSDSMADLCWSGCSKRLSKKNIRLLRQQLSRYRAGQLPDLPSQVADALRCFGAMMRDLQLQTSSAVSDVAQLLQQLVGPPDLKQAVMKRPATMMSKKSSPPATPSPTEGVALKCQVSGVQGEGISEGEALTASNLNAFAAAVQRTALVDNLQPHLSHVVEEFRNLVPENLLKELTWQQVQERISGKTLPPEAFLALWQEKSAYKLCSENDVPVQLWWEYLSQQSSQELSHLFTWCTGFAAPPATAWKFQIQVVEGTHRFPSINTCLMDEGSPRNRGVKMPTLYLPSYESMDALTRHMRVATTGTTSMAMHLR